MFRERSCANLRDTGAAENGAGYLPSDRARDGDHARLRTWCAPWLELEQLLALSVAVFDFKKAV
jgi:hypothetical protein